MQPSLLLAARLRRAASCGAAAAAAGRGGGVGSAGKKGGGGGTGRRKRRVVGISWNGLVACEGLEGWLDRLEERGGLTVWQMLGFRGNIGVPIRDLSQSGISVQ